MSFSRPPSSAADIHASLARAASAPADLGCDDILADFVEVPKTSQPHNDETRSDDGAMSFEFLMVPDPSQLTVRTSSLVGSDSGHSSASYASVYSSDNDNDTNGEAYKPTSASPVSINGGGDDFVLIPDHDEDDDFVLVDGDADNEPDLGASKFQLATLSARSCLKYVKNHPFTAIAAPITAAPAAAYSLAVVKGSPADFGAAWWNSMTRAEQVYSVTNAAASFAINTFVNVIFFPQAATELGRQLKQAFNHIHDRPGQLVMNLIAFGLGITAATASGMISYGAFGWLPYARFTALAPSAFAFVAAFASRYVGTVGVFKRVEKRFSERATAQQQFINLLSNLSGDDLDQIKEKFRTILVEVCSLNANLPQGKTPATKPLTNGQFNEIIKRLAIVINQTVDRSKINLNAKSTSNAQKALTAFAMFFDIAMGVVALAPPAFLTHMQKGFDGINMMTSGKLSDINPWAKIGIGATPGIAPSLLYGICGYELRATLLMMCKHCYKHPASIPLATLLLAANALSSSSMKKVAEGIMAKPTIFGFNKDHEVLSKIFIGLNLYGGAAVNLSPTIKAAYGQQALTLQSLTFEQFLSHLKGQALIGHSSCSKLKQLSMFNQPELSPPAEHAPLLEPVSPPSSVVSDAATHASLNWQPSPPVPIPGTAPSPSPSANSESADDDAHSIASRAGSFANVGGV